MSRRLLLAQMIHASGLNGQLGAKEMALEFRASVQSIKTLAYRGEIELYRPTYQQGRNEYRNVMVATIFRLSRGLGVPIEELSVRLVGHHLGISKQAAVKMITRAVNVRDKRYKREKPWQHETNN